MSKQLEKTYNPHEIEDRIYKFWLEKKYFKADVNENKKSFTIVIPPPNITGHLHMGHALDNTLQDILIRMKRMQGYETLWQPGTDHASIATEIKILEQLAKEGITKEDLTRDEFLEKAWKWKDEYGGRIVNQLKKLGASCDWDRLRFTMDEGCSKAVFEFFKKLYDDGLIYRDKKIINWCPKCKTTISDAEVDYVEKEGAMYHIKYMLKDGEDFLDVATTRPETLLGDTAVVVHPDDERYKKYIGKTVILPILNKEIPVLADEYVDMEFGSGVVKVTPAHDPNDFEIGKRHNLEFINVMNDDGTMNSNASKFEGMDRYDCRKKLVDELKDNGLLIRIDKHVHNVGTHERCGTDIEPLVKSQWFVKMEELAKPAIEVLEKGELKLVPKRFDKIYLNWLNNIRDWCISRQLWWGHQIPVVYCEKCGHIHVVSHMIDECEKCGSTNLKQDEDTLDTWFSSALWPFSTLGWPEKTPELEYFYPTNTLVTGYDIIFFWVIRMVFSGLYNTGKCPFDTVLLHGLIRDSQGRKMSKSLGNGIDPLEVIDNYGADALRYSIVTGNAPGADMRFYDSKVEAARNFANKIWNASRFILMNDNNDIGEVKLCIEDKWIISKLNKIIKEVTANMEKYELGIAVEKLHNFLWEEFCDWYIEMVKPRLFNKDETSSAAIFTLKKVLVTGLKLLHPFMPFITEEIYKNLTSEESIMISDWPLYKDEDNYEKEEEAVEIIKDAVRNIRNTRANLNIAPSKKTTVLVMAKDNFAKRVISESELFFAKLSYANKVEFIDTDNNIGTDYVSVINARTNIYLPLFELIDIDKEIARLEDEIKKLNNEINRCETMLNNDNFVSKAPKAKVDAEREKLDKYRLQLSDTENRYKQLKK